jgi:ATP-dependent Zn protease
MRVGVRAEQERGRRLQHRGGEATCEISIIPRTMSLGVTGSAPESDRFNYDKRSLLAWSAGSG